MPLYSDARSLQRICGQRLKGFEKQKKEAINERSEKKKRAEKYRRVMQSVEHAQYVITRQNPAGGRLLKKKMHAVKARERRFETEDEIYFKLGDETSGIPAGKTVIEYSLDKLWTPDGSRILSQNIFLRLRGEEKICIIGSNGSGKTTLLKKISEE